MLTKHCGRKSLGLVEAGHCVSFALGLVSYKFEFTEILININTHLTPSQCILWWNFQVAPSQQLPHALCGSGA